MVRYGYDENVIVVARCFDVVVVGGGVTIHWIVNGSCCVGSGIVVVVGGGVSVAVGCVPPEQVLRKRHGYEIKSNKEKVKWCEM